MSGIPNDDDIWNSGAHAAAGDATVNSSAFDKDVLTVIENQDQAQSTHPPEGAEQEQVAQVPGSEKTKLNIPMLAGAGVILAVVLGGLGFFGYKKFYVKKSAPIEPQIVAVLPKAPASSASVFGDTASTSDIFATTVVAAASAPAQSSESVPGHAQTAVVTSTPSVSAASMPPSVASQGSVQAPTAAVISANPVTHDAAQSQKFVVATPNQQTCACDAKEAAPIHKTRSKAVVAAHANTSVRNAKKTTKKSMAVANTMPTQGESTLLTRKMRVVGVFPLTGKNAQAWVQDSKGRMQIVRKDEFLDGVRVLEVIPEKNLVKTMGGNIASSGLVSESSK